MFCALHALTLTVDASGDATVYTSGLVNGRVLQMRYVPDGTNPLATGADLTITGETTGVAIVTITNIGTSAVTKVPRQATLDASGAASLYAAGGTAVNDFVYIGGERIKCVVAQGGVSKTGTLYLLIG